ncbi:MAG TPA: TolC family protein, partial [Candidatus Eremiobacteraceae bacterium]|nr:TolC family protein [Candidatus Eremiobacteraceae bacterium]
MKRSLAVGILFAFVCGQCVAQEPAAATTLTTQQNSGNDPQQQTAVPASTSTAPANGAPGASRKLTLKEAEALALRNNPQISIGKLRALEAREYVREASSALLPTAYLSLTAVDSDPGGRIAAGGLTNPTVFPRAAAGATVSQLVTDFGRTTNLVSSSKFQSQAEDQNAAATTADITLAVDQAFYNSLETRDLVAVADQTVHARQTLVDKIQALTNAKLRSDLDLSFAKVDVARAKLLLLESQNNFQTALAALSAILGYQDEQNFELQRPDETMLPPAPEVEPLIMQALQQRPELQSLQFQIESAQKNDAAEHDLWRPSVNALGTVGLAPVRDPNIPSWYGAVGVNVNIPIFNGFLYSSRAKAADLQTEIAKQKFADSRNNIARDVRTSWQQTNQAYERLSVTQQLSEQANLALNLAQSRYNLGLSSIVEFTQAELGKTEADIANT